jgi:hypothetical protein
MTNLPELQRSLDPAIHALGIQGTEIQSSIYRWHNEALLRLQDSVKVNTYFQLAFAHYHALLLFLSRDFTYYPCWDSTTAPLLPQSDIKHHATAIINSTEQLLKSSDIPGVMLLFPLRLAGCHAQNREERYRVLQALDRVYWKGFVVSNRVQIDLEELWGYEGVEFSGHGDMRHIVQRS